MMRKSRVIQIPTGNYSIDSADNVSQGFMQPEIPIHDTYLKQTA